jgi:ABC-type sugar transport system ATPase subunit
MQGTVEFQNTTKTYGPIQALVDFSHRFEAGRVHSLMGKNGSGKSTLIKLLAGAIVPTAGDMRIDGRPVRFQAPRDAFDAGIVTVHQELSLVPTLSVAENIFLGRLPRRSQGLVAVVDWARVRTDAMRLLAEMEIDDIAPDALVETLSVGQQQTVEIVKAMSFAPKVLLLDEPTSALAAKEVEHLFALVRRLKARGVTILYITHRMNELFDIADTCTVLRDGRFVGSVEMSDASPEAIVEMMFGDIAKARRPERRAVPRTDPILSVRNLCRHGILEDVGFDLYRGEILGFAGMLGAGRTEVLRAVFGADPKDAGTIVLDGETIARPTPKAMKERGLGYTPENRKEVGLVQLLSIHDNLCLASLKRIAPGGVTTRVREAPFVARQISELAIKAGDPSLPVSSLSGGNQQKVVIGNWLNTKPKVMFFDEPSRGIDVQAKQQIFEIMWSQAAQGISSIFVSSEPEELLDVADRILVFRFGRIVAEVSPKDTTLAQLYRICMEGTL